MIVTKRPTIHVMKKEIQMLADELQREKAIVRAKLREIESLKLSKQKELSALQQQLMVERANHQTEVQSLAVAIAKSEAAQQRAEAEAARAEANRWKTEAETANKRANQAEARADAVAKEEPFCCIS